MAFTLECFRTPSCVISIFDLAARFPPGIGFSAGKFIPPVGAVYVDHTVVRCFFGLAHHGGDFPAIGRSIR